MMKRLMFVLLLFFLLGIRSGAAQWIRTGAPYGGPVFAIAGDFSGKEIFAGGLHVGVYVSTDGGMTWEARNNGLNDLNVLSLAVSGNYVFAGTDSGGIFVSSNGGQGWASANSGLPIDSVTGRYHSVRYLSKFGTEIVASAPYNEGTTAYSGLFLSTDGGSSWIKTWSSDLFQVTAVGVVGSNVLVGLSSVAGYYIYRSTDGGSTFQNTSWPGGVTVAEVSSFAVTGSDIFAGTRGGGVFLSTDGGVNWTTVNNGFPATGDIGMPYRQVSCLAASGDTLFAATDYGSIVRSTDLGSTWTIVDSLLSRGESVYSVFANGISVIASTFNGLYRSNDSGMKWNLVWRNVSPGFSLQVYTLAAGHGSSGAKLYAGTFLAGLYISSDGGKDWLLPDGGLGTAGDGYGDGSGMVIQSIVASGAYVFAGDNGSQGIFRSSDSGLNWVSVNNGLTNKRIVCVCSLGPGVLASTYSGDVYRSTDLGANWTDISNGNWGANCFAADSGRVVAAGQEGVYISSDSGATWTAAPDSGLPGYVLPSAVVIRDNSIFLGTAATVGNLGLGVLLSNDSGANWTSVSNGLPGPQLYQYYAVTSVAINGQKLFAGTRGGGVYLSTNSGRNWTPVNEGLPDSGAYVTAMVVADSTLYIALVNSDSLSPSNGVWKRPISEMVATGVRQATDAIPRDYYLSQNYPNPFNPSTAISYRLSAVSDVTLKVCDVLGREVATLVNERQNPGVHTAVFDGSKFASGVYFYRLTAPGANIVRKMALLK